MERPVAQAAEASATAHADNRRLFIAGTPSFFGRYAPEIRAKLDMDGHRQSGRRHDVSTEDQIRRTSGGEWTNGSALHFGNEMAAVAGASGPEAMSHTAEPTTLAEVALEVSTMSGSAGTDAFSQQHCSPSTTATGKAWHGGTAFDGPQWLASAADADAVHTHGSSAGVTNATKTAYAPIAVFRNRITLDQTTTRLEDQRKARLTQEHACLNYPLASIAARAVLWHGAPRATQGAFPENDTMDHDPPPNSRRHFLRASAALGTLAGIEGLLPAYSFPQAHDHAGRAAARRAEGVDIYDLEIANTRIEVAGQRATATTINGTVPGPLIQLQEGQETILRVTNRLREDTSVHWHGLLVPPEMDGVPGVSFPGIRPGETFEYRFPLKQYGTYWYHSHSGLQEQLGHYGPLIVLPKGGYPYSYDREHTIVLSDWTFENPYRVLAKLKKQGNYYNRQRRTLVDLVKDVDKDGFMPTLRDRLMWARMRMDPTDIMDVTGATYTYLMNGLAPETNWTGLFRPGERVLLHIINAAADSYFDVRIPGLPMTLVQVMGQYVQPVETDEVRIAIAETYDVIVRPADDRPYTLFAESADRSGYAAGTLATKRGTRGTIPPLRERPVLTMADMGMSHGDMSASGHEGMGGMSGSTGGQNMPGMDHSAHGSGTAAQAPAAMADVPAGDAAKYAVAGAIRTSGLRPPGTLPGMQEHEADTHGVGNAAVPMMVQSRLADPGPGLGNDGWRVLVYTDLRALEAEPRRAPDREIEMHLTGNMERFIWTIDGKEFRDSEPVRMAYGERIRLTMVNDTMMQHPMHLHGMWMELENGHGKRIPRVHTINVKPAERISLLITADAPGRWAFHCHVLYHMEVGMFRVFEVGPPGPSAPKKEEHHGH